jgi:hypothetical protein
MVDGVELRAERGRAVLINAPERFHTPSALAGALDEWAEVVDAVCRDGHGDPEAAALVSARGRQLAARLAAVAGTPVGYADPVRGVVEQVTAAAPVPPRRSRSASTRHGAPTRHSRAEPTPWATGLTVSAFFAAVTSVAVFILVSGLGEVAWWLGLLGLLVVTGGLAPSLWLARHTPLWRWLSYGVAAGIAMAWVALALSMLGP